MRTKPTRKSRANNTADFLEVGIGCLAWVFAALSFFMGRWVFGYSYINSFWVSIGTLIVFKVVEEIVSRINKNN